MSPPNPSADEGTTSQRSVQIYCQIAAGMFSNERVAILELGEGKRVVTLVDESLVEPREHPPGGKTVSGTLTVSEVERTGDKITVDLPEESFRYGTRVLLPMSLLAHGSGPR
ncbi:MAG TPA: hypothetical protein VGV89_05955 [Thermoplasmata archaeon]|nr:hypothetical protein [Thermoplasmata archaeon]